MQNTLLTQSDTFSAIVILAVVVFVHASFQLSVSVLTLLNAHTLTRKLRTVQVTALNAWYIIGAVVTIALLTLGGTALLRMIDAHYPHTTETLALIIAPLTALMVVLFYYRRGPGTRLWLPRPAIKHITERAKKTRSRVEAFSLGSITAFVELPFTLAPIAIFGLILSSLPSSSWLYYSMLYSFVVCVPLLFVMVYITSGHSLSSVQHWREDSKGFLKWSSAIALILLTIYILVIRMGGSA